LEQSGNRRQRIRGTTAEAVAGARQLRQRSTPAEETLWEALRGRRLAGARFRRQHTLGPYVLDFCCAEHRLVVEVDGSVHNAHRAYDEARTEHLQAHGYRVLRVGNDEVMSDLDGVLAHIAAALTPNPPPPMLGEGVSESWSDATDSPHPQPLPPDLGEG